MLVCSCSSGPFLTFVWIFDLFSGKYVGFFTFSLVKKVRAHSGPLWIFHLFPGIVRAYSGPLRWWIFHLFRGINVSLPSDPLLINILLYGATFPCPKHIKLGPSHDPDIYIYIYYIPELCMFPKNLLTKTGW